jgi:transcriptional regulator with XRE-family HTH domain
MPTTTFDAEALYGALDAQRRGRGLTWKKVAEAAGVSASTLTRMAQGRRPDVDSLAALLRWSGLDAAAFIREDGAPHRSGRAGKPEPLAMISTYLRSDPNLTRESATALDELIKATYQRLRRKP